jgi:hypothetical protein
MPSGIVKVLVSPIVGSNLSCGCVFTALVFAPAPATTASASIHVNILFMSFLELITCTKSNQKNNIGGSPNRHFFIFPDLYA